MCLRPQTGDRDGYPQAQQRHTRAALAWPPASGRGCRRNTHAKGGTCAGRFQETEAQMARAGGVHAASSTAREFLSVIRAAPGCQPFCWEGDAGGSTLLARCSGFGCQFDVSRWKVGTENQTGRLGRKAVCTGCTSSPRAQDPGRCPLASSWHYRRQNRRHISSRQVRIFETLAMGAGHRLPVLRNSLPSLFLDWPCRSGKGGDGRK